MSKEILIYALPKGETRRYCEELISVKCQDDDDIERVKAAASAAGYHSFRIAYYNGEKPNFLGALNV